MNEIQFDIFKTLAYFDLFDYPLTEKEVEQWLWVETCHRNLSGGQMRASLQYSDITQVLKELVAQDKICQQNDLYFLPGRQEIVALRKRRLEISVKKIKRARQAAKILAHLPWLKAIFLCNSVGQFNADENSDIDLFVVVEKGRIWLVRFWAAGIFMLLGWRPNWRTKRNKFCLSYFVTEDNLNLEPTKIGEQDIALVYWLTTFWPLYESDNLWSEFKKANQWLLKHLPNFVWGERKEYQINFGAEKIKKFWRTLPMGWLEKLVKKFELWYLPKLIKKMANQDTRVIINDQMLKLHTNDSRAAVNQRLLKYGRN